MRRDEIFGECLNLRARRAARALTRRYDAALRPAGLSVGQFSLLTLISEEPVPSMTEISDLLGVDRTTLLAALKPLSTRGLLNVAPNPEDRRARSVAITPEGREALSQAFPLWRAAQAAAEASLDPDHLAVFHSSAEALAGVPTV